MTKSGTVFSLAVAPKVSVNLAILVGKTAANPKPKIAEAKKIGCQPVEKISKIVPSRVSVRLAQIIWLLDKNRAKIAANPRPKTKKIKKIKIAESPASANGKFERKV